MYNYSEFHHVGYIEIRYSASQVCSA